MSKILFNLQGYRNIFRIGVKNQSLGIKKYTYMGENIKGGTVDKLIKKRAPNKAFNALAAHTRSLQF